MEDVGVRLGIYPSIKDGVISKQPCCGLYVGALVVDVDEEQGQAKDRSFGDPGDHLAD